MDWRKLFLDFSNGLIQVVRGMNQDLEAYANMIDEDFNCDKAIAKASQIQTDINRILNYMDDFYYKEGLKHE